MRTPHCICLVWLLSVFAVALAPGPMIGSVRADAMSDPAEEIGVVLLSPSGLESVLGREVRTEGDRDLGRIIDVLADPEGRVRAVVIEFGGFLGIGTRKIAVDWTALHFDAASPHSFWLVDVRRDEVRAAPEYKPDAPVLVPRAAN